MKNTYEVFGFLLSDPFFPPMKLDSLSNYGKDSRTIVHSSLRNQFPLPQIPPSLHPRVAMRKCLSVHGVPLFCEGKAFLILFISRNS